MSFIEFCSSQLQNKEVQRIVIILAGYVFGYISSHAIGEFVSIKRKEKVFSKKDLKSEIRHGLFFIGLLCMIVLIAFVYGYISQKVR